MELAKDAATRLQELFDAALDRPEDERRAFVERACADDPALRDQVLALLSIDQRMSGTTVRPIVLTLPEMMADVASEGSLEGTRVGPYLLHEALGHGGMGQVYRAERVDGLVEQQVAIKFIRRELLDADALRRFQLERQLLASFDHPNIARLLDAARLEDGTPYFVMEFIDGVPITEYCSEHGLGVRDRVLLLRRVCSAVSEAHRKLVVHRDLKPSNLLVTRDGTPKLLDFGIAKPLNRGDVEATQTSRRFFSPQYAAPEQLLGTEVGVACDVYGLGLLLYEVLAEQPPFDFIDLSLGQIERLICEIPPELPSVAATANLGSTAVGRQLRGDVDDIVMRCLRKAPTDRYPSVERLEADLDNYLEGRPVSARGAHRWYRFGKFVRRNLAAVVAASFALLALIGGMWVAVWQARVAEHRANELAEIASVQTGMLQGVFGWVQNNGFDEKVVRQYRRSLELSGVDPKETALRVSTLEHALATVPVFDVMSREIDEKLSADALARIGRFHDQPLLQSSLRETVVEGYLQIGLYPQALPLAESILSARRELLGDDRPETQAALRNLAELRTRTHDTAAARELWTALLKARRGRNGALDPLLHRALAGLAETAAAEGDYDGAERHYREVLRSLSDAGIDDERRVRTLTAIGVLKMSAGRLADAEALFAEAGQLKLPAGIENDRAMQELAWQNGRLQWLYRHGDLAARTLSDVIKSQAHFPGMTQVAAGARIDLATIRLAQDNFPAVRQIVREMLSVRADFKCDEVVALPCFVDVAADELAREGKWDEAIWCLVSEINDEGAKSGLSEARRLMIRIHVGRLFLEAGRDREAVSVLQSLSQEVWDRLEKLNRYEAARYYTWYARGLARIGRLDAAERNLDLAGPLLDGAVGVYSEYQRDHADARVRLYESWSMKTLDPAISRKLLEARRASTSP